MRHHNHPTPNESKDMPREPMPSVEQPLRPGLPPVPPRMKGLPRDKRGYPVPYFVQWFKDVGGKHVAAERGEGEPDFRVTDGRALKACVQFDSCWLCGQKLGTYVAYVIGPMCAVNRVSGEPPCHKDCAIFGATACPFLSKPKAGRREAGLPEEGQWSESGLKRNPGVALVWVTRDKLKIVRRSPTPLFHVGSPVECLWFAEGREATRAEVLASIDSGMPLLEQTCDMESTPEVRDEARRELAKMRKEVDVLLPA